MLSIEKLYLCGKYNICIKNWNHSYLRCLRGDPTFPTLTGVLYSKHNTSASWASILHNSSMNCISCTRTLPARSPLDKCLPSGEIRIHRTPFFWSYTVLELSLPKNTIFQNDTVIFSKMYQKLFFQRKIYFEFLLHFLM